MSDSPPTPDYKYWAFISYSSKDVAIAKKLHRALETYRIPRELVGRPGRDAIVPKNLFPVFRDRDEFPLSANLGSSIEDALRASRYLIVICTPNSAKSKWVNEEIRHFQSLGRRDRVFAIVADGICNASDKPGQEDFECFPPALRYRIDSEGKLTDKREEPIAGDMRKSGDGWRAAFLKAVAGITGMGYNAFAKREEKRERRRRILIGTAAMILSAAAVLYWDYVRVKVKHFGQVTEQWGVPAGVNELDDTMRRGKEVSFRFEYRKYKVRKVSRMNSSGSLLDDAETGAARTDVIYREDGTLERLLLLNRNGRMMIQKTFSRPSEPDEKGRRACAVTFLSKTEFAQTQLAGAGSATLAKDDLPETRRSDITAHQLTFGVDGRIETLFFRNSYGSPISDSSGVYGRKFKRDANGLVTEVTNLDVNGVPLTDRSGSQWVRSERDTAGNMIREIFLNEDGNPILGPELAAEWRYSYDRYGNLTERQSFDAEGKPNINRDLYSIARFTYDKEGHETAGSFEGIDRTPVTHKKGYSSYRYTFDPRGYLSGVSLWGNRGEPVMCKDGYAAKEYVNDTKGNLLKSLFLDIDGRPVTSSFGYASVSSTVDEKGNYLTSLVFDPAGKPVLSKYGNHKVTQVFDDLNNLIEVSNFNSVGEPTLNNNGVWKSVYRYDERGNRVEEAYYGVDGKLALTTTGVAKIQDLYDAHGGLTERRYLGLNGRLTLHQDGMARYTQLFDKRGNLIEIAYFDTADQPVVAKAGWAKRRCGYDDRGREIRREFFGPDGKSILDKDGRARVEYTLDQKGNKIEQRYFGVNRVPATDKDDVAVLTGSYDERGNQVSLAFFGTRGEPITHKTHQYSKASFRYDQRGNLLEISFRGTGGEPVISASDNIYQKVRSYDQRDNLVEERYLGVDGKPTKCRDGYFALRASYDDRGNRIEWKFFDAAGHPMANATGIARVTDAFDPMGRRTEESFWDLDGNPVADSDGIALIVVAYNHLGNQISQEYYGIDGKPALSKGAVSKVIARYDVLGNAIEYRFYGLNGKLANGPKGVPIEKARYDARGILLDNSFFDASEAPAVGKPGYSRVIFQYNRNGKELQRDYLGSDGQLMIFRGEEGGIARILSFYDDSGNLTEKRYLNEKNEPVLSWEKIATARFRYSEKGERLEWTILGVDGLPIICSEGFAKRLETWDDQGRRIEVTNLDTRGNLCIAKEGFAKRLTRYDEVGNIIEESYHGPGGELVAKVPIGYARVTAVFNSLRQPVDVQRFGADGKPLAHDEMPYREITEYDDSGNYKKYTSWHLTEEVKSDSESLLYPTLKELIYDGNANLRSIRQLYFLSKKERGGSNAIRQQTLRDGVGRELEHSFLDRDDKPTMGPEGYAREVIVNDAAGNTVRTEYLDLSGRRASGLHGVSAVTVVYDNYNRQIEARIYDAEDKEIASSEIPYLLVNTYGKGPHIIRKAQYHHPAKDAKLGMDSYPVRKIENHDENGKLVGSETWWEISGTREEGNLVIHVLRKDSSVRVVESLFLDQNESLISGPDKFARKTIAYDEAFRDTRWFDTKGPFAYNGKIGRMLAKLDEKGRIVETTDYGADHITPLVESGYATAKYVLDEQGRQLKTTYFDAEGKPSVHIGSGYHRVDVDFDARPGFERGRGYDTAGQLVRGVDGWLARDLRRDAQGRVAELYGLDENNKAMLSRGGVYGVKWQYLPSGLVSEEIGLNVDGSWMRSKRGYARQLITRDLSGRPLNEEFFDEKNRPAAVDALGFNSVGYVYGADGKLKEREVRIDSEEGRRLNGGVAKSWEALNAQGSTTEFRYFDDAGRLVTNIQGVSIGKFTYDHANRMTESSYFDPDGRPTIWKGLYHRYIEKYDGNLVIEAAYLDVAGNLSSGIDGWARYLRFAPEGKQVSWKFFTKDGRESDLRLLVEDVVPGGQADRLGLIKGDQLLSYEEVPLIAVFQLIELVERDGPERRSVKIKRNGQVIEKQVMRGKIGAFLVSKL